MRSLIPRKRHEDEWSPAVWGETPFTALHHRVDQLFDELFESFAGVPQQRWPELMGQAAGGPRIEVSETDQAITVKAELPGMDEKDIEILLDDNVLTIQGEKKEEHKEKKGNVHVAEMRYGQFSRTLPLPQGIDRDQVTSSFKKGVLCLTLPKTEEAQEHRRRIEISTED